MSATYHSPTTLVRLGDKGAEVIYMISLNKRTGFPDQDSYDAEVARVVAMGVQDGIPVRVDVYAPGDVIA